jgi:hypothetical protein
MEKTMDEKEGVPRLADMAADYEMLNDHERLALRGSARVCANLAAQKYAEAGHKWAEVNRLYHTAIELDKAARALSSPPPPTVGE